MKSKMLFSGKAGETGVTREAESEKHVLADFEHGERGHVPRIVSHLSK